MAKKIFDIILLKKEAVKFEKKKNEFRKGFLLIPLIIIFIGAGVFGLFWFSEAELTLYPKTESILAKETIVLSLKAAELDLEKKIMPASYLESAIDLEREFQSTGATKKETKAFGVITVYNEYSDAPRILVPSRFVSAEGKVFWSKDKVIIPGRKKEKNKIIPGEVQARVEAEKTGESYNIGSTTFALPALAGSPLYTAIYAKSFSAMLGGNIGEAEEVTESDLKTAKNTLLEKAISQNKELLFKKLPKGMELIDEVIVNNISKEESSAPLGAISKSFKYKISVSSKALVFAKSDIDEIVGQALMTSLQENEDIESQSLFVGYVLKSDEPDSKEILLNIEAKKFKKIEIGNLKKSLAGKSAKEAKLFLNNLSGISKIEFKLKPFLQTSFPKNENKINIKVKLE